MNANPERLRSRIDHAPRLRLRRHRCHQARSAIQNARLLGGDFGQRLPEDVGVLEVNIRNHANLASERVRRIQAPSQPTFDDRPLHAGPLKREHGRRRQDVEPTRRTRRSALDARRILCVKRLLESRRELLVSNLRSADSHALVEPFDVRRGKHAGSNPLRFESTRHERRHRALALGPRDMNNAESALGIAQPRQQIGSWLDRHTHASALRTADRCSSDGSARPRLPVDQRFEPCLNLR